MEESVFVDVCIVGGVSECVGVWVVGLISRCV